MMNEVSKDFEKYLNNPFCNRRLVKIGFEKQENPDFNCIFAA